MKRLNVRNLKAGDSVGQTFLISDIREAATKNGKPYANFVAGDQTGSLNCVWWELATATPVQVELLRPGLVELFGDVTEYNGKLQLKIAHIAPPTTEDISLFEKRSKYGEEAMWSDFTNYSRWFESRQIIDLADKIVTTYPGFLTKPAATGMHHAFKHGLLEHTLQMLITAEKLFELRFYAEALNKDYCMFGIMFHDFGKIFEYGDAPDFKRTVEGILVPHIPRMAAIIEKHASETGISEEMMLYLQSIILSHHRFLEWGSPIKPATPEALFVHYVDNLHGDVFGVLQKLESDTSTDTVVKYGFGDQAYTLVKKRFSEVLAQEELANEKVRSTDLAAGPKDQMVGF